MTDDCQSEENGASRADSLVQVGLVRRKSQAPGAEPAPTAELLEEDIHMVEAAAFSTTRKTAILESLRLQLAEALARDGRPTATA